MESSLRKLISERSFRCKMPVTRSGIRTPIPLIIKYHMIDIDVPRAPPIAILDQSSLPLDGNRNEETPARCTKRTQEGRCWPGGMRPCTQPRAPVLPINSRIARPGIRQLGVVTFRSVPPRPIDRPCFPTTLGPLGRHGQMQPTPSGGSRQAGRRGSPRLLIHLGARYWSARDPEERPLSGYPRCARARAYWSNPGHGTGSASVAGAARTRRRVPRRRVREEREKENERERLRERGKNRNPGRALRRECSRAGNQCRFRGSGGHHAADYPDYTDYICTPLSTIVSFPVRPYRTLPDLIPSAA